MQIHIGTDLGGEEISININDDDQNKKEIGQFIKHWEETKKAAMQLEDKDGEYVYTVTLIGDECYVIKEGYHTTVCIIRNRPTETLMFIKQLRQKPQGESYNT